MKDLPKKKKPARRRFSQDFSGNSLTDQSFTASCDVNNIVRHYADSAIVMQSPDDPLASRVQKGDQGTAATQSYSEALAQKRELDSYFLENDPPAAPETPEEPPQPPPAEPPPEASTDDKSGE